MLTASFVVLQGRLSFKGRAITRLNYVESPVNRLLAVRLFS